MQVLYSYFQTPEKTIVQAEKELFYSINKSFDQYHYLLLLSRDIADYASKRIEIAKQKRLPSEKDVNPNTKFIDNRLIKQLGENEAFNSYVDSHKISWIDCPELIKSLYDSMIDSDLYKSYMESEEDSFEADKKFLVSFYKDIIPNSELLYQILEEQSIYWNDEVDFIISMILKTFKKFQEGDSIYTGLMPLFKNADDESFVKKLFRKVVLNDDEYKKIIKEHTKNWDVERIAYTDILLLDLAIAEILEFPTIPANVTFNEYIEISKFYSTKRSSTFINGILDKIVDTLKKENKIKKEGRGLLEKSKN